jgi:hypothetical protein
LYANGQGVPQDYAQAATWYRKAAEQGLALAQDSLGSAFMLGQGVPQDYTEAAVWFRKAAGQGDSYAEYSLGAMYEAGNGVTQDNAQAAVWYRKAAEQGYDLAQWGLGSLYTEAYFWLDIAATGKIEGAKREDVARIRDIAASRLTPANLTRVQERARKWFEDHPPKANP